ncbi:MAG: DUF4349 domain-containing protein [Clostridium sp.]|nr:DUF4349 domain-containing protein [Clostridium sp.]
MKRKWTAILLAAVLILAMLAGCASGKQSAADNFYYAADEEMEAAYGGFADQKNAYAPESPAAAPMPEPAEAEYDTAESLTEESSMPGNMVNDLTFGENVKLIFRAWLRLQTLDFAKAEEELNLLVEKYGGYFESVYTDNGSYYSTYNRLSGSYTVRVPAANYDRFLKEVGNTCHVVNMNKTTEDVGLQYSDIEMRLATERAKQERLLALLKQATEMSDIIQLESAISDCQYQIDSLTSSINRYDSLIGFSTVNIELEQVERLDNSITEEESFWTRLAKGFKDGLEDFTYGIQDLAIWFAYNLLGILVFLLFLFLIVKLCKKFLAGRIHLPKRGKKAPSEEKKDE